VNTSTCNLRRPVADKMLSDPAQRSLKLPPARRVCRAANTYRIPVAVRGCVLLATDSRNATVSCRSADSSRVLSYSDAPSIRCPLIDSTHCTRRLRKCLPESPSSILCTCYTTRQLPCATSGRMIAPYQSSTLRDVPFRLYGSPRAVKVVRPCRPDASTVTALAPPVGPARMASRRSNRRQEILET
jgi:hypothetical protein